MNKLIIVTGQYGCGKTEFSLNLALKLNQENINVAVADYDVINPYFRSREKASELKKLGINVVGNVTNNTTGQDLPALSGNIFTKENCTTIVDLAGSENGINPLVLIKDEIKDYELLYVVNVFRPECRTLSQNVELIKKIEEKSNLKVTGLVNNSHMVSETSVEHILEGDLLTKELGEVLGIPVKYTHLDNKFVDDSKIKNINTKLLTFNKLNMRENWQM